MIVPLMPLKTRFDPFFSQQKFSLPQTPAVFWDFIGGGQSTFSSRETNRLSGLVGIAEGGLHPGPKRKTKASRQPKTTGMPGGLLYYSYK